MDVILKARNVSVLDFSSSGANAHGTFLKPSKHYWLRNLETF